MNSYLAEYKPNTAGLYIHFPYCIHKCAYCDFYSIGVGKDKEIEQEKLFQNYLAEFFARLKSNSSLSELEFETIFIGGGTPSMANLDLLEELISTVKKNLQFSKNFEFSMEANPEDITKDKISGFHQLGVNRLNVGVQSFLSKHLKTLDRFHIETKYQDLMGIISDGNISRIGIDLMYGIPDQSLEDFFADLEKALNSKISHISLYSLTAEKGTEYYRKIESKKAKPPNEEIQIQILDQLPDFLNAKGFEQYEVSNFAKNSSEFSMHNLKYWKFEKYFSIGPSAHGFLSQGRYSNKRSIENYLQGNFSFEFEPVSLLSELAICLLRLFCKINFNSYQDLLGNDFQKVNLLLKKWNAQGLCEYRDGIFQWNQKSILDLDSRILEFSSL